MFPFYSFLYVSSAALQEENDTNCKNIVKLRDSTIK